MRLPSFTTDDIQLKRNQSIMKSSSSLIGSLNLLKSMRQCLLPQDMDFTFFNIMNSQLNFTNKKFLQVNLQLPIFPTQTLIHYMTICSFPTLTMFSFCFLQDLYRCMKTISTEYEVSLDAKNKTVREIVLTNLRYNINRLYISIHINSLNSLLDL